MYDANYALGKLSAGKLQLNVIVDAGLTCSHFENNEFWELCKSSKQDSRHLTELYFVL